MAYLLNATKTPTACRPPYMDKTHLISLTQHSYYYHFFLLSYKHFTQAGPVMQLVMFEVPLKLKKITPRITNSSVTHYTNGFRGIIKVHEINV